MMMEETTTERRRRSHRYPLLEYEKGEEEEEPSASYEYDTSSHNIDGNDSNDSSDDSTTTNDTKRMVLVFVLLVVFGTANVIFGKLQAVPMYNYPNFLNLFSVTMYIPLTFAYILPVAKYGLFDNAITAEQLALSKRPFAIMGCLDCMATMMQIFASVYLPGPLLILLPQAAIPISMCLSRYLLDRRYRIFQYVGAVIVLAGIIVVLEPMMTHRHGPDFVCRAINEDRDCSICQVETDKEHCLAHRLDVVGVVGNDEDLSSSPLVVVFESQLNQQLIWSNNSSSNATTDDDSNDDEGQAICEWVTAATSAASSSSSTTTMNKDEFLVLVWSFVMLLSCVPMTLSSIYKEIALDEDLDPIYMNGWIALFQFFFSLVLAVPAGLASSPSVLPADLPRNLWHGLLCYLGIGTITTGCHPDSMCSSHAALFVNLSLLTNGAYVLLMMYTLKFGSASLLYLALTAMVPLGNLFFALPFMPHTMTFHISDLLGLSVIMCGLILYRFADSDDRPPKQPSIIIRDDDDISIGEVLHSTVAPHLHHHPHHHNDHPTFTTTSAAMSTLREPLLTGEADDV